MEIYYFTFGSNSEHHDEYVKIQAESYSAAREVMFEHWGDKWAFQYSEKQFKGQPERYGLMELLD